MEHEKRASRGSASGVKSEWSVRGSLRSTGSGIFLTMADKRTTADKLRDVANHPRTPPHEAEAARGRLRAMGESLTKTRTAPQTRVDPARYSRAAPRPNMTDIYGDAFGEEFVRQSQKDFYEAFHGEAKPWTFSAGDPVAEEMKRQDAQRAARARDERDRNIAAAHRRRMHDEMSKARTRAKAEAAAARLDAQIRRNRDLNEAAKVGIREAEKAMHFDYNAQGEVIGVRNIARNDR